MQGWGYFVQILTHQAGVPFATSFSPIHLPIMFCLRSDGRGTIVNSETWRRRGQLPTVIWFEIEATTQPSIILAVPKARRLIRYLVKGRGLPTAGRGPIEAGNPHCGSITISRIYTGVVDIVLSTIRGFGDMLAGRLIFKCWRISVEV